VFGIAEDFPLHVLSIGYVEFVECEPQPFESIREFTDEEQP
jgi:hypothetical protein